MPLLTLHIFLCSEISLLPMWELGEGASNFGGNTRILLKMAIYCWKRGGNWCCISVMEIVTVFVLLAPLWQERLCIHPCDATDSMVTKIYSYMVSCKPVFTCLIFLAFYDWPLPVLQSKFRSIPTKLLGSGWAGTELSGFVLHRAWTRPGWRCETPPAGKL